SRIKLGDVTPHNIKQLKRLNQVIFPVNYNDKFCKDVLEVAKPALNHVLNICEKDGTFDNIYLKFGSEIIETKKNYSKRIQPADAHLLQKNLKVPSGQNADVQKTDN
uniref:Uncharacterized protein n=1 Tax=Aotus nancymaae TaxID=37293 RepID=A0A2K5EBI0_AOTNA